MRIPGSYVLLTGASGGIGQAIARALAARGASLTLSGRRMDVLEPLARELDARAVVADLSRPADVDLLIEAAGRVDILIANAGLPAAGGLESFTREEIDRAVQVNLRAPIVLTHALLPAMVARDSGHLLFVSSVAARSAPPGSAIYTATKAGLSGFAGSLRADLHDSRVGVSTVLPGFVRDAGMFAETGVGLPWGVGTVTPERVARAAVRSIERNRGRRDVASPFLRASVFLAQNAPDLAHFLGRRLGSMEIARAMEQAERDKR